MAQNPISGLLTPFRSANLELANRVVMAPMTRYFSPGGIPGPDVASYYAKRAEAGVGLIVTEGAFIPHPAAGFAESIPVLFGEEAMAAWRKVTEAVHGHHGKIAAQLWHIGSQFLPGGSEGHEAEHVSASGLAGPGQELGKAMTLAEVDGMIDAYASAAVNSKDAGFDGIELHAAHGYLIDGFFWQGSNVRSDHYGGSLVARTRLGADIVRECRALRVGFPDHHALFAMEKCRLHRAAGRDPAGAEHVPRPANRCRGGHFRLLDQAILGTSLR